MKKLITTPIVGALVVLSLAFAGPACALTYFLQNDLGVHDNQHLCKFSNGKVYAYNATDLCPMQVEDDGPVNYGNQPAAKQTGFKSGEYQDGMTKVCVYSVLGRTEAIRLSNVELCPLTYDF